MENWKVRRVTWVVEFIDRDGYRVREEFVAREEAVAACEGEDRREGIGHVVVMEIRLP